jgi:hypothetical protein
MEPSDYLTELRDQAYAAGYEARGHVGPEHYFIGSWTKDVPHQFTFWLRRDFKDAWREGWRDREKLLRKALGLTIRQARATT